MAATNGLGWTFDTVASTYEKMRPGYVPALYQTIFDYCHVGPESHVLEIGSGGGQATGPMLQTGCLRVEAADADTLLVTRFADNGKDAFGQPVDGPDVTIRISRK